MHARRTPASSLSGRLRARLHGGTPAPATPSLHPIKLRAIERAFERAGIRSFADLGGVWAVDGGYTFFALERFGAERAVLVDDDHTEAVRARARSFPQLSLVTGNFGAEETVARVGRVDAVMLFDVLLHQVAPDWDQVLELYAPATRCFVIVNPQWTHGERTVRLMELGRAEYLRSVPPAEAERHGHAFDRREQVNERRGRPWGDVHDLWQWGITDNDLHATLSRLGFRVVYFEDAGPWGQTERYANRAFAFLKEAS